MIVPKETEPNDKFVFIMLLEYLIYLSEKT